ncbi:Hsp20/alpha crystallin family protein [Mycolicibacterium thermoresistibile]
MSSLRPLDRPGLGIERLLDSWTRDFFGPLRDQVPSELVTRAFTPAAEVAKDGEDAVIRLELAGVDVEKDVNVELDDGHLVIHGERRDDHAEKKDDRTLREVRYGSFRRSFALPAHISKDDISASYDAGVLTVRVAGAHGESEGQRIAIEAK